MATRQESLLGRAIGIDGAYNAAGNPDGQVPVLVQGLPSDNELVVFEAGLPETIFTFENSSLAMIDRGFAELDGKSFIQHLADLSKRGNARILEIGGGIHQTAALEILTRFPGISRYVALEKRPISLDADSALHEFASYEHIQRGVSEMTALEQESFDVVFAHHVAEHLPNPFVFIEQAHGLLAEDGRFSCNMVPLYDSRLNQVLDVVKQQEPKMASRKLYPEKELIRQGIIFMDLTIGKSSDRPLTFHGREGDRLTPIVTYGARILRTRDIRFHY